MVKKIVMSNVSLELPEFLAVPDADHPPSLAAHLVIATIMSGCAYLHDSRAVYDVLGNGLACLLGVWQSVRFTDQVCNALLGLV